MSPKRIVVFFLLMLGSPFWVALRSHYGERFAVLLLIAWSAGFGSAWVVAQGYVPDLPRDVVWTAWLLQRCFEASLWMWAGHLGMLAMYWGALALRECEARHPWYVGAFWLSRWAGGVMTLLGIIVLLFWFGAHAAEIPEAAQPTAYGAFAIMAGSFVTLLFVSDINGSLLPVKPPLPRRGRKSAARYIARTGSPARRSREKLSHIFSRRDPALRELTNS